ncbi:MAG: TonB-dependent receptor [Candidatus Sulfotelmatobacter sp.]
MKTLVLVMLGILCCATIAPCQTETATISGRITDPSGAVVSGADVQVQNVLTAREVRIKTNESGLYLVTALQPGTYRVIVSSPGFKQIVKPNIALDVQQNASLNFSLTVGSASETVTVESGAPHVNTESATVSTVVTHDQVENMPLNGRSFQSLITLTPGIVATPATYTDQGQFSVNGQRTDANYFNIDGVSGNVGVSAGFSLTTTSGGALPAFSIVGGTAALVSVESMQEFTTQTSTFSPEFGRFPGAQISIATRSGTNAFHGTAFDYLRNGKMDANDWFADNLGLPKAIVHQNDFGGVFGGPVLLPGYDGRNRTFFFFSYEGLRLTQPVTGITLVPTLAVRQAAASSVAPWLNAFPLPNGPVSAIDSGLAQFDATYAVPSTMNATSIRIDHVVNSKLTLFGRYNDAPSSTPGRGEGGTTLSELSPTNMDTKTATIGATWLVSQTMSDEFRGNWSRSTAKLTGVLDNFGGAVPVSESYAFPPGYNSANSETMFFILDSFNTFASLGLSDNNSLNQWNFTDSFAVALGHHQLKFGVDYRSISQVQGLGTYVSDGLFLNAAQAQTGISLETEIEAATPHAGVAYKSYSLFAQDTFVVTPRLTLTYGLRWDVDTPPSGLNGFKPIPLVGLNDPTTATLGTPGAPLWATTYGNIAPRVGIAYQLSKRSGREAVLRTGFGRFYGLSAGNSGNLVEEGVYPNSAAEFLNGVPFPVQGSEALPPPIPGPAQDLTYYPAFDPHLNLPRTYEWNAAVEQSLGSKQSVSVTYIGSAGRSLLRQEDLANLNSTFQSTAFTNNSGKSDYNAMQVQYQRRLSDGLEALVAYTFSHSIDNSSSPNAGAFPEPQYNPQRDRGPSDFDVRHLFAASVSYSIPMHSGDTALRAILGNWSVDGIARARSALPVNVQSGCELAIVNGVACPRADLVSGQPLYLFGSQYLGGKALNPAAFTAPPAGEQGTLSRNALLGFGMWQLDTALRRQFDIRERVHLQFRAEFFNIFNHPNFASPVADIVDANFGQSLSMLATGMGSGGASGGQTPLHQIGGPRSVQLALKLQF